MLVVCGADERARGEVQLKDMSVGRKRTAQVADRSQWKSERPGQFNVPHSIAIDAQGLVYVADRGNNRVVKLAAGSSAFSASM